VAFILRNTTLRRLLLVFTAVVHAALTVGAWLLRPGEALDGWLSVDAPGLLFLSIASGLFLTVSFYAVGFLQRERVGQRKDYLEGVIFTNAPEAIFTGSLLMFLATMTLVCVSHHFGLLWVAVEATTLASAPLIYFHRHHRSLEATWKYLMLCSVGIALALLGNFFLAIAATGSGEGSSQMVLSGLLARGPKLQVQWLRVAFLFFLVGYGTKMGLAPLHTWLPDAHSESPSLVSALLSGALLNCAFLGILRAQQVLVSAGQAAYGQELLILFGVLSIGFAAVFILHQTDYKRMLAYSSVEHMGIVAFGVGLGGAGGFGAMLHALNHSIAKAMLFLVAGNILGAYHTRSTERVRGLLRTLPVSGRALGLGISGHHRFAAIRPVPQ
jgi:hydrogenase-4 component F